jgi:uncharacterized protein
MSRLDFEITHDPAQFAGRAESFLADRLERNVLATVLLNILNGPLTGVFAVGVDRGGVESDGQIQAAALRTPPWPMLATGIGERDAGELLSAWLVEDPDPPGVNAEPETARAIAAAWAVNTGGRTHCSMREAMHVLDEVRDPPRPAAGVLRSADPGERPLLTDWMRAFVAEAGVAESEQADQMIEGLLTAGRLFVWDNQTPVSMLAFSPRVAGVTRIGPVYTPPELRQRGYASSAVAAASRRALADGAQRCALFTDLANPTSNKIYADVGYRKIADWEEHRFEA